MTTPPLSTPRVTKTRADRKSAGVDRFEVVSHPDDKPIIKAYAAGLLAARGLTVRRTKSKKA